MLDATIDSIGKHGFADTTTATISEIADVSTATIHHHFSGKDDLLCQSLLYLLRKIKSKFSSRVKALSTPKAKLEAAIVSVLDTEQNSDSASTIWLSFWVHAEYYPDMKRLRDVYSRRLYSNLFFYINQIIGDSAQAHRITINLIAMMHGAWISMTLRENNLDAGNIQLIVQEYLEQQLSAEGRANS